MLVLTRHNNERIIIQCGDDIIELVVVRICEDKVRLGFEAPSKYRIDREEVYELRKGQHNEV